MDARTEASNTKYYFAYPLPLLGYIYSLRLTQIQERVYLYHWGAGNINGDWRSQVATSVVAKALHVSESSVKRAYRELTALGLMKRETQGMKANLLQRQATITEVLLPDEAVAEILNAPSRAPAKAKSSTNLVEQRGAADTGDSKPRSRAVSLDDLEPVKVQPKQPNIAPEAKMVVEPAKALMKEKKSGSAVLDALKEVFGVPLVKKVDNRYAISLRQALRERLDESAVGQVWNQMMWSLTEGPLALNHPKHSINIALKLLRQQRWAVPSGMPDGWEWNDSVHV